MRKRMLVAALAVVVFGFPGVNIAHAGKHDVSYEQASICSTCATEPGRPITNQSIISIGTRVRRNLNCADGVGNITVHQNLNLDPSISDELWKIERVAGNGELKHGDAVYLRTRRNHYLNTDNGTGPSVKVARVRNTDPGQSDEIWWIERVAGNGVVRAGDAIYLRTRMRRYLNTDKGVGPSVKVTVNKGENPENSDEIWWIQLHY